MSRIAKKPIQIPAGVKVASHEGTVTVEGPKGRLACPLLSPITLEVKDKALSFVRPGNAISDRMRQGTMHRLVANMIEGVSKGFQKNLVIEGVGFKAELKGTTLAMSLGFTHPVEMPIPQGITVKIGKPTEVAIEGASKELVGLFTARVRSVYEPEPYKGKGIRYAGEVIRRKAGKAVVK